MKQTTLAKAFIVESKGLHSGEKCRVQVGSGAVDSGYVIKYGKHKAMIAPWRLDHRQHCTAVKLTAETTILTVEHLLAALFGMGVDNAEIEIQEGTEIPGADGSALEFAQKIKDVGISEQDAPARYFQLKETIGVGAFGSCITAVPLKERELRITYQLDYPQSELARGIIEKVITPEVFLNEIAPARTFVMQSEAEALQKAGFGKGANTQNTLVLNGKEVVNNTLRFAGEPMAHKLLDIIGDLASAGRRLGAQIIAHKSGHALNQRLAQALRLQALASEHPGGVMNIKDIAKRLPHRYPFLLVDRVLELEPLVYVHAYKNITRNEEFFNGHFPNEPIMPGVLQIEALAQAGAVGMLENKPNCLAVLTGVDEVKYRRQVVPGDQLHLSGHVTKYNGRIGAMFAQATVNGELACSAVIKFAFINTETGTL